MPKTFHVFELSSRGEITLLVSPNSYNPATSNAAQLTANAIQIHTRYMKISEGGLLCRVKQHTIRRTTELCHISPAEHL